jgi:hypothetical protein
VGGVSSPSERVREGVAQAWVYKTIVNFIQVILRLPTINGVVPKLII